jgi:hypothetical protein
MKNVKKKKKDKKKTGVRNVRKKERKKKRECQKEMREVEEQHHIPGHKSEVTGLFCDHGRMNLLTKQK